MNPLRSPDTGGLAGSFIPVVAYDIDNDDRHFAAAHYHEPNSDPLPETEQIVGYEAISDHTRGLLEDYVTNGNLIALVDAVAIMETYDEFFGAISAEQIDVIITEITAVSDINTIRNLMNESKNARRIYQGLLAEVKMRLSKMRHIDRIKEDPLVVAYIQSHAYEYRVSELEAITTLLEALQNSQK